MAKPEWGVKRLCGACGARFYDLQRDPIACPECGAIFEVEAPTRGKRLRPAPRAEAAKVVEADLVDDEIDDVEDEDEDALVGDDALVVVDEDDADDGAPVKPVTTADDTDDEDEALDADDAVLLPDEDEDEDETDLGDLVENADDDDDDLRR